MNFLHATCPCSTSVELFLDGVLIDASVGGGDFEDLSPGDYTVVVSRPEHELRSIRVQIPRQGSLEISLPPGSRSRPRKPGRIDDRL